MPLSEEQFNASSLKPLRLQIMQKAKKHLAEEGIFGFKLAKIAADSDCNILTVLEKYASKENLITKVILEFYEEGCAKVGCIAFDKRRSSKEKFEDFIYAFKMFFDDEINCLLFQRLHMEMDCLIKNIPKLNFIKNIYFYEGWITPVASILSAFLMSNDSYKIAIDNISKMREASELSVVAFKKVILKVIDSWLDIYLYPTQLHV